VISQKPVRPVSNTNRQNHTYRWLKLRGECCADPSYDGVVCNVCVGAAVLPQGTHILEYQYLILRTCSKIMRSISIACQSFAYVLNTMNNEHYTRSASMFIDV